MKRILGLSHTSLVVSVALPMGIAVLSFLRTGRFQIESLIALIVFTMAICKGVEVIANKIKGNTKR